MLFPFEIVPQLSRLMMAGLAAGHLALGVAFLHSSLPSSLVGLALMGLLASNILSHRRWLRRAGLRFVLQQGGEMQVFDLAGAAYAARADKGCRDLGWAIWLAWHGASPDADRDGQHGILMLPRDALSPEAWRALRVWLRFQAGLADPDPTG